MNSFLTATIPVKPYLLKFVHYYEKINPGEPLNINNGGALAYNLMLLASNKNELRKASTKSYYGVENELTAKLRFTINTKMQTLNRMFWHRDAVVQINTFLYLQFNEYLQQFIEMNQSMDPSLQYRDLIMRWMDMLGINDDDIDYDSIKKANYRFREKKNNVRVAHHLF